VYRQQFSEVLLADQQITLDWLASEGGPLVGPVAVQTLTSRAHADITSFSS
jgi:hypothetical protein